MFTFSTKCSNFLLNLQILSLTMLNVLALVNDRYFWTLLYSSLVCTACACFLYIISYCKLYNNSLSFIKCGPCHLPNTDHGWWVRDHLWRSTKLLLHLIWVVTIWRPTIFTNIFFIDIPVRALSKPTSSPSLFSWCTEKEKM